MSGHGKVVGKTGTSAQPFRAGKKRAKKMMGSNKPASVKAHVMSLRNAGQSYPQISRAVGISQNTVMHIVHEQDQGLYLKKVQEMTVGIAEEAARILKEQMVMDGWLAFKYLDRIGGFPDQKQQKVQVELSKAPEVAAEANLTQEQLRQKKIKEYMAKFAAIAYERSIVYEQPLPDEFNPEFALDAEEAEMAKVKQKDKGEE